MEKQVKTIQDKIKDKPHMTLISNDGFQAIVHTNKFNDCGKKVNAILIYTNDDGDGLYGKPSNVISGTAYDIVTILNK